MAKTAKLDVKDGDILEALRTFFRSILELEDIGGMLVPRQLPMNNTVMPALVTDPAQMEGADPLAPAFPLNAAKLVSRLTRKPMGQTLAAVLRPCEIRALVELVKLKQGCMDELLIIATDCLGAMSNRDYAAFAGEDAAAAGRRYQRAMLDGQQPPEGARLAAACRVCEFPVPAGADLLIGLYGLPVDRMLLVKAQSERGERLLEQLGLESEDEPADRARVVADLIARRTEQRDRMFAATTEATDSIEKLTTYLAACVNCYNCRVACPVCYCKECVFVTDVFNHEPAQYLKWARRKGAIKMPTDTTFYHITRIAHMSTACVGCGQCSNACPNDIPVMELFRTAARRTQAAFEYQAGRDLQEPPPLSVFREDELSDVVGIGS